MNSDNVTFVNFGKDRTEALCAAATLLREGFGHLEVLAGERRKTALGAILAEYLGEGGQ